MATLNLSNGIRMNNPNATEASDSFLPNANAAYGPHASLDAAKRTVSEIYGAARAARGGREERNEGR